MRLAPAILRSAALLVPAAQRAEWLDEWMGELSYVSHHRLAFCLGSFRDALWLRCHSPRPDRPAGILASPVRCLSLLALFAAASLFLAVRLHLLSATLAPSAYLDARNLALIHAPSHSVRGYPSVSLAQYQAMAGGACKKFSAVAFYRPQTMRLRTPGGRTVPIRVAIASANLFDVLGTRLPEAPPHSLILSNHLWRRHFGTDPHTAGRVAQIDGQPALIGAVLQGNLERLPGWPDAWLLEDREHLDQLPSSVSGFVLARVRRAVVRTQAAIPWSIDVPNRHGGTDRLECHSVSSDLFLLRYLMVVAVSLLVLSAVTPLALGYYPRNRYSPRGVARHRRWIFFGVKLALLVPAVYYGSFDVASLTDISFQPFLLMVGLIVGLRWALIDQRQRCPVCLRRLTSPTRIGGASRTLLEWYGTEFICTRGHGLLYVPEIPTSSYSTQQWQDLDPSWTSLFS